LKHRNIPNLGLHNPASDLADRGTFTYGKFEDNIRAAPVRTGLHRHEFHEVFLFEAGTGTYRGDFEDYPIKSPCAVVIPSGTVHEWPDAKRLRGHAMAFDLDFLHSHGRVDGPASILRPPIPVVIPLEKATIQSFKPWLERMAQEWLGEAAHRKQVFCSCLSLILIDLRRHFDEQADEESTASDQLYAAFLDELERTWKTGVRPKDLAATLHVTPDHLSSTLRTTAGKNASDLITERVLLEAKRLLAHSRLGIAEIAYEVGHDDPSYFARFFKRHAGTSPKDFRVAHEKPVN